MTLTLRVEEMMMSGEIVGASYRIDFAALCGYKSRGDALDLTVEALRGRVEAAIEARRRGSDGWRRVKNVSSNRFHYYGGGTHCLCGRWKEEELMRAAEIRPPLKHVDAKDCVLAFTELGAKP